MSGLVRGAAGAAVLSAVVGGMALVPAGVASAQANLLPNPTFAGGTTSGWKGTNAKLSVVTPGFTGDTYAGKAALTTGTSYSMFASPHRPPTWRRARSSRAPVRCWASLGGACAW